VHQVGDQPRKNISAAKHNEDDERLNPAVRCFARTRYANEISNYTFSVRMLRRLTVQDATKFRQKLGKLEENDLQN
jgi:tryptophan 2,3-dioxygenase